MELLLPMAWDTWMLGALGTLVCVWMEFLLTSLICLDGTGSPQQTYVLFEITCDACGSAGVLRTPDCSGRRQFSFLAQQQRIWILPRKLKQSKS